MKNQLQCPNCNEVIPITWGRYWKSATNFYRCPNCKAASRFATKPGWIQFSSWAVQTLPLIALYFYRTEAWIWFAIIPVYIVIFFIDKRLDERFGILVRAASNNKESESGRRRVLTSAPYITGHTDLPKGSADCLRLKVGSVARRFLAVRCYLFERFGTSL